MKIKVYLSFLSKDRSIAKKIIKKLRENGIDVFYDNSRLSLFGKRTEKILNVISECDFFIPILSNFAFKSDIIISELEFALHIELKIKRNFVLPIVIYQKEKIKISDFEKEVREILLNEKDLQNIKNIANKTPPFVGNRLYIDLNKKWNFDEGIRKLVNTIKAITNNMNSNIRNSTIYDQNKNCYLENNLIFDIFQSIEVVYIRSGKFIMGCIDNSGFPDEYPSHEVVIDKPFWISIYPIDQMTWFRIMGQPLITSYEPIFRMRSIYNSRLPVNGISWFEAQQFIEKLNLDVNYGFTWDLPSEEEWEYAARAGTKDSFFFGNNYKLLKEFAWFNNNSNRKIHPVGELNPNPWGIFDILGNIYEWCKDDYRNYENKLNLSTKRTKSVFANNYRTQKVIRGGSFETSFRGCRVSSRSCLPPEIHDRRVGFRVVLRKIN